MSAKGYLVVLTRPEDILASQNPKYRGLYRTPPWSASAYEKGFDDPYVFGDFTNEIGLIKNLRFARQVKMRFSGLVSAESLELIYVRSYPYDNDQDHLTADSPGARFLGFDVAAPESPFWSLLPDFPSEAADLESFLNKLNKFGLFDSVADSRAFLEAYIQHKLPHHDSSWVIWSVSEIRELTMIGAQRRENDERLK
jgi:hypothetical protein